jgi:hypothetical protein
MTRRERAAAYRTERRATGHLTDPTLPAAVAPDARAYNPDPTPLRIPRVDPVTRRFDRIRQHPVRQTVRQWGGRRVDQGEVYAA